jgi:4-hydroxymandelate oxidase
MASGDDAATGPRLTQRQRSADEPALPDDPGRELPFLDLAALEQQARERLAADVFDYYAGGAGAETTLTEAPGSWRAWRLRPRVLRGVQTPQLGTALLDSEVRTPIGVAPWAYQGMAHPEGERATARGAAATGSLMTVSTSATT